MNKFFNIISIVFLGLAIALVLVIVSNLERREKECIEMCTPSDHMLGGNAPFRSAKCYCDKNGEWKLRKHW